MNFQEQKGFSSQREFLSEKGQELALTVIVTAKRPPLGNPITLKTIQLQIQIQGI